MTRVASPQASDGTRPDWNTDGANWPNRTHSRFVMAGGLRWHIQELASPPVDPAVTASEFASGSAAANLPLALLVHGTGAATHSWYDVLPILARDFRVLAMDLPGHGFTDNPGPSWLAIDAMSKSLVQLLDALEVAPDIAIGHSAGAALLTRMAIDQVIRPKGIVSINGALLPFGGIGRTLFPTLAKLLFLNPFVPQLFARQGRDRERVAKLLANTGSRIPPAQVDLYARLMRYPAHISGALGMMANWDLEALKRDLPQLDCEILLMAGERDKTVPPTDALEISYLCPHARVVKFPKLGHLAHEEDPAPICAEIVRFYQHVYQQGPDSLPCS